MVLGTLVLLGLTWVPHMQGEAGEAGGTGGHGRQDKIILALRISVALMSLSLPWTGTNMWTQ